MESYNLDDVEKQSVDEWTAEEAYDEAMYTLVNYEYIPPQDLQCDELLTAINKLWTLHEEFMSKVELPALDEENQDRSYGGYGYEQDPGYYDHPTNYPPAMVPVMMPVVMPMNQYVPYVVPQ